MWTAAVTVMVLAVAASVLAAPAAAPQTPADAATPNKSALSGTGFDEIQVTSTLTVKGRSGPTSPQRAGRTKLLVVPTPGTPIAAAPATNVTAAPASAT